MKLASDKTREHTKRAELVATIIASVLVMTRASAGLQATANADLLKAPELAKLVVRRLVVSLPDKKLALLRDGQVVRIYRIAIGKPSTPTPVGDFKIVTRVTNPTYYHKGQVIPAGKDNPVGSRWMGLSARSYGIHGTNQPKSIGAASSTGCIRMGTHDLEELFTLVAVEDAVEIHGERDEHLAAIFGPSADTVAQAPTESVSAAGGGQ